MKRNHTEDTTGQGQSVVLKLHHFNRADDDEDRQDHAEYIESSAEDHPYGMSRCLGTRYAATRRGSCHQAEAKDAAEEIEQPKQQAESAGNHKPDRGTCKRR